MLFRSQEQPHSLLYTPTYATLGYGLPAAIGAGLSFSAVSNTCAMASVLAKMPWNRPAQERSAGDVIGRIPTGAGKRS